MRGLLALGACAEPLPANMAASGMDKSLTKCQTYTNWLSQLNQGFEDATSRHRVEDLEQQQQELRLKVLEARNLIDHGSTQQQLDGAWALIRQLSEDKKNLDARVQENSERRKVEFEDTLRRFALKLGGKLNALGLRQNDEAREDDDAVAEMNDYLPVALSASISPRLPYGLYTPCETAAPSPNDALLASMSVKRKAENLQNSSEPKSKRCQTNSEEPLVSPKHTHSGPSSSTATTGRRTIEFGELLQENAIVTKFEGNWYLLRCDSCRIVFKEKPYSSLVKHLTGEEHLWKDIEREAIYRQFGTRVLKCNDKMAEMNNEQVVVSKEKIKLPSYRKDSNTKSQNNKGPRSLNLDDSESETTPSHQIHMEGIRNRKTWDTTDDGNDECESVSADSNMSDIVGELKPSVAKRSQSGSISKLQHTLSISNLISDPLPIRLTHTNVPNSDNESPFEISKSQRLHSQADAQNLQKIGVEALNVLFQQHLDAQKKKSPKGALPPLGPQMGNRKGHELKESGSKDSVTPQVYQPPNPHSTIAFQGPSQHQRAAYTTSSLSSLAAHSINNPARQQNNKGPLQAPNSNNSNNNGLPAQSAMPLNTSAAGRVLEPVNMYGRTPLPSGSMGPVIQLPPIQMYNSAAGSPDMRLVNSPPLSCVNSSQHKHTVSNVGRQHQQQQHSPQLQQKTQPHTKTVQTSKTSKPTSHASSCSPPASRSATPNRKVSSPSSSSTSTSISKTTAPPPPPPPEKRKKAPNTTFKAIQFRPSSLSTPEGWSNKPLDHCRTNCIHPTKHSFSSPQGTMLSTLQVNPQLNHHHHQQNQQQDSDSGNGKNKNKNNNNQQAALRCPHCGKEYFRPKNLNNHIFKEHHSHDD